MHDVTCVDLAPHTTLRLGGPARRLITLSSRTDAVAAAKAADADGEPTLVLAGGSNVVIADAGFPGTVLLLRTKGMTTSTGDARGQADSEILLTIEAGHPWDEVVARAVDEGWAGIECLAGVPGSAGATPIQNVGAYGQEIADTLHSVRVLDRHTGSDVHLSGEQCRFTYRGSLFKHNSRYIVLAVTLRLVRSGLSGPLRYPELAGALGVRPGGRAPLSRVREAVLGLRASKGMVLDADDLDTYSVGSFFTNPVVDADQFAVVSGRAVALTGQPPTAWPTGNESMKLSAAWLIERSGCGKGFRGGRVGVAVSGKHSLALTNRGTGTTSELLSLAGEIRDRVDDVFGVSLVPEPILVNCSLPPRRLPSSS